ncbi:Eco57I restriction-modification methylase domain-containing protein [Burkholderia cepacia]|nr:Eco57I restriction-modification methylase domain-containing protein [Burkholderia cepacia]
MARRRAADKQHRWLSQVDINGVVLSEPVLADSAPAGFRALEKKELAQFYKAREIWNLPNGMVEGDSEAQWIDFVLEQMLRLAPSRWQVGSAISERFVVSLSQQRETIRPSRVLLDDEQAALLFVRVPRGQGLDNPWNTGGGWKASPTTKLERLLRETGVELGLVTNGEAWRLLVASPSETAAWLTWTAQTWADSPSTLAAFIELLGEARFFAGPRSGTILELVRASRKRQADVADQLGLQVREALEIFVRELDRIDVELGGTLLSGYKEDDIFESAASLLMRMVFLLKAEESGLLPHGSVAYDRAYGVLHLLTHLERAHRLAPDKLDGSQEAYAQLLGTFRLVYEGSTDPDINVPAYGGDLFDPESHPLLEGRLPDARWPEGGEQFIPLPVRDSVVRDILRSLKYVRGDGGVVQWISYGTLEVEQIGHMYEGLLDLKLGRAPESSPLLLLIPTDKTPCPTLPIMELAGLSTIEMASSLATASGRSASDVLIILEKPEDKVRQTKIDVQIEIPPGVAPALRLTREFGLVRPQGLYVDYGNRRHDQGAVYTPVTITEPMVRRALEPLVYVKDENMSHGRRLRTARELLSLRVCDPAMGSGAFLVQAVRYLAEHVVDSWDEVSAASPSVPLKMPYATLSKGAADELLLPEAREERLIWARRFVAERCVYGVDVNPLAVEMGKLSLWLTTLAKDKAFTFLDHALRCGNSVIGADLDQLRCWSLNRMGDKQPLFTQFLEQAIKDAVDARHTLTHQTGRASEKVRRELLARAEAATERLGIAADLLVSAWIDEGTERDCQSRMSKLLLDVIAARTDGDWTALAASGRRALGGVRPMHWTREFPEVFIEGTGFDAVIGNPPYVRQEILGPIKPYLKQAFDTYDGVADLYVYFYELGLRLLREGGRMSLIVTNKWMKAGYGEPLRNFLSSKAWVDSVVDFGHAKQIFKGVDVFPSIVTAIKPNLEDPPPTARICVIDRSQLRIDDLTAQLTAEGFDIPRDELTNSIWQLDPPPVRRLFEKIRNAGESLTNYVGAPPLYGIKTGRNDAFVIDHRTKARLIAEDPKAAEIIFPFLRGRDIKRWSAEWPDLWMIFSRRGIDISRYPSVLRHLEQYRTTLEPKPKDWKGQWAGRKSGTYKWYELQDPVDYWQEFKKPKIFYQVIQYAPCFALDRDGFLGNDKTYFVISDDLYLLGVLNSSAMWWHNWRFLAHMKDDALNPAVDRMASIPIPMPSNAIRATTEELVSKILEYRDTLTEATDSLCEAAARLGVGLPAKQTDVLCLDSHGFAKLAKRSAGQDLSRAALKELGQIFSDITSASAPIFTEIGAAEAKVNDLISEAYGLSTEDLALIRLTAPPRTPGMLFDAAI